MCADFDHIYGLYKLNLHSALLMRSGSRLALLSRDNPANNNNNLFPIQYYTQKYCRHDKSINLLVPALVVITFSLHFYLFLQFLFDFYEPFEHSSDFSEKYEMSLNHHSNTYRKIPYSCQEYFPTQRLNLGMHTYIP